MKQFKTVVLCLLAGSQAFAQYPLQSHLNMFRSDDSLVKQQVSYKDPGRSGEHVLWDFSQLAIENQQYKLEYSSFQDSIIIGQEHYTQYLYQQKGDSLVLLKHQNPVSSLTYLGGIPVLSFPFSFGQGLSADYQTEGVYSKTVPLQTSGSVAVLADAYGKMLLPSGDTLSHVLRVKTTQFISEKDLTTKDSLALPKERMQETYRWYSPGYRYPIFETIINKNPKDNSTIFSTAFFFPPTEHYYLEEDEENLALLESLRLNGNVLVDNNPWSGLTYNCYPNPVVTSMELEIDLPRPAQVKIQITDKMGMIALEENWGALPEGISNRQIYMGSCIPGEYVLNVLLNGEFIVREVVLKR